MTEQNVALWLAYFYSIKSTKSLEILLVYIYRDDGLGVTKDAAKNIDIIKKSMCSIFQKHHLKITIEVNKKVVNYLDINFDISKRIHKPNLTAKFYM